MTFYKIKMTQYKTAENLNPFIYGDERTIFLSSLMNQLFAANSKGYLVKKNTTTQPVHNEEGKKTKSLNKIK